MITSDQLDHMVKRAAIIGCPRPCEREEFRQDLWIALLEGRIEICELYDRHSLKRFWLDTRFTLIADGFGYRGLFDPIKQMSGLTWADVIPLHAEAPAS